MAKIYARLNWENSPSQATPRNAENLNVMDKGIDDLDNAVVTLQSNKIDKTSIVATDTVNDNTKVAGAGVVFAHGAEIDALNTNLGVFVDITSECTANSNITLSYVKVAKLGKLKVYAVRFTSAVAGTVLEAITMPTIYAASTTMYANLTNNAIFGFVGGLSTVRIYNVAVGAEYHGQVIL